MVGISNQINLTMHEIEKFYQLPYAFLSKALHLVDQPRFTVTLLKVQKP